MRSTKGCSEISHWLSSKQSWTKWSTCTSTNTPTLRPSTSSYITLLLNRSSNCKDSRKSKSLGMLKSSRSWIKLLLKSGSISNWITARKLMSSSVKLATINSRNSNSSNCSSSYSTNTFNGLSTTTHSSTKLLTCLKVSLLNIISKWLKICWSSTSISGILKSKYSSLLNFWLRFRNSRRSLILQNVFRN